MQTMTNTVNCPSCGQSATITLFRESDPLTAIDRDSFEYLCRQDCALSDQQLICVWAHSHEAAG